MSVPKAVHRRSHTVRHHECGDKGGVKLALLLDFLQDAAAEHAEFLGCGMEDLIARKRIWVLSRLKLRILRRPELKEQLDITTYPSGRDRLFAYRQYCISCGGEDLLQASSAWLMLDGSSYRPLPMEKAFDTPLPENSGLPVYFDQFAKIPDEPAPAVCSYDVRASDLDLNHHLNNAVYARYIEDVLGELCNTAVPEVRELQINFQHSGQLGDRIDCSGVIENNTFRISGGKFFTACGILAEK